MPVSPKDILKGSILCFEGQAQVVKAVSEFIMFENRKEWIGGSLINGEPISEEWLVRFGFRVMEQYDAEGKPAPHKLYHKEPMGTTRVAWLGDTEKAVAFCTAPYPD